MVEWIYAAIIVFIASTLQAAIGFGFAVMATPFLLLVIDSRDVIQMSNFLSLFTAIILMPKIRHDIDHSLLKSLIVGGVLGVPLGLLFFAYVSLDFMKISIGIIILMLTFFQFIKNKLPFKKEADNANKGNGKIDEIESPEQHTTCCLPMTNQKDPKKRNELLVGLCAGAFTTSVGMPGVPLVLYFSAKNTPKVIIRSTTLAFFIAVYIMGLIIQILTTNISFNMITSSFMLIPFTSAGVFLGNMLFYKINQNAFNVIANIILLLIGFYMLLKTI